jgi:P4 family phage/plasmid primase-like protien
MNTYIGTHKISVTIFRDQYAKKMDVRQWTLPEMRDEVLKTSAATKKKLPWLKMADFGTSAMPKSGSLRHDANVLSVVGCELDYDDGLMSFEEAVDTLRQLNIRALVYTSPSNTKTKSKWRILAPFSRSLPPPDRKRLTMRLNGAFGNIFDPASLALSQSFYYGAARDNEAADHRAVVVEGDFIDLRDDLAQFEKAVPENPLPPKNGPETKRGFEGYLALVGDGPGLQGFNNPLCSAVAACARQHGVGLDRAALMGRLREVIGSAPKKPERTQHEIERYLSDNYLDNLIASAISKYGASGIVLPDKDHMARARKFRESAHPNLVHYRGTFWNWDAGAYSIVVDDTIDADTWTFLDGAAAIRGKGNHRMQVPFHPNRTSVAETIAALKAVAMINTKIETPSWLDGENKPQPAHLISFPNGLLDLRDNRLHPPDPSFFTTAALGFNYVAEAPPPVNWSQFLSEIYAGDDCENEMQQVQEIFGYLLTADVSHQKAFFFIGPKRSGKGTMLRMLQHLLAPSAVAGPTLKSLGSQFGLQPLIGKQVAVIDDLRVGSSKDTEVLIENMLKITGRGHFTIDRKFTTAWEGTLPLKLVLLSNVMPKLGDDSGALASRFIISNTTRSFYDKENRTLFEDLLGPELPGVFHWALEGLQRLRARGRFTETEASKESKSHMAKLGSPVLGFIQDMCELGPDRSVPKNVIFAHWCDYCQVNGLHRLGKEHFFSALYAAAGSNVRGTKTTNGENRVPSLSGIDMSRETKDRAAKVHLTMRDDDEGFPF